MRLFLDTTRVATRILWPTPTGIDRVEFAYVHEILNHRPDIDPVCVMTTPWFTGAIRTPLMKEILLRVDEAWGLQTPPTDDLVFQRLKQHLEQPAGVGAEARNIRFGGERGGIQFRKAAFYPLRDIVRSSVRLDRRLNRSGTEGAIYLNTSHNQLNRPHRFTWLGKSKLRPVIFVHDAIPIDFPEFVSPAGPQRHITRLETVAEVASLVIVNSQFTRTSLETHLRDRGLRVPEIEVVPLGVASWFTHERPHELLRPPVPYFVTVGTIEPRKNLLFLFAVWRRLAETLGPRTPRLVVVGARGWENENVIDSLDRSKTLGPHVIETSGLTDAGLASLLKSAVALVNPSSVEGFGLPLIEALSLGCPVIASDIAAHREVSKGHATLLDPIDGRAWVEVITSYLEVNSPSRQSAVTRAQDFRPMSWQEHVGLSLSAIARVA